MNILSDQKIIWISKLNCFYKIPPYKLFLEENKATDENNTRNRGRYQQNLHSINSYTELRLMSKLSSLS